MSIRRIIEIRLVGDKADIEQVIASMYDNMKRVGWSLAKQPSYRQSRKDPEDVLAYTQWVKTK